MMEAVGAGRIVCVDHLPCTVITEKTTISNLNIIHFSCIVSLCHKNLCTHLRQYIALLFYIILLSEQQCVTRNIITSSKVYCLMNVCSCFVMVLKLYIFGAVTHSRWWWGMVIVWRVTTLPMSCYIVRKITTNSVPQSYAGYLRTSQSIVACDVTFPRSFVSVLLVICGIYELKQRK